MRILNASTIKVILVFCTFVLYFGQPVAAQEKKQVPPLEAFSRFVGVWHAPDSVVKKNPSMQGKAIFKLELDEKKTHLKFYESISLDNNSDYAFMALLAHNPLNGFFEFMGINTERNFLFKGIYKNVNENGFAREYDVSYPAGGQMAQNFGQIVSFRETFRLENENILIFDIKYFNKRSQAWENWSDDEHIVVRKN